MVFFVILVEVRTYIILVYNKNMKIALIQMNSEKGNIEKNLELTKEYFKQAIDDGAEVVVFPEMNVTGYFVSKKYLNKALTLESKEVLDILNLTNKNNFTIIFGIAELLNDKFYITQIIGEQGKIVGVYRKHNIINDETNIFTASNSKQVFYRGDLSYGITICADIDLPDLYEEYAKLGCNLIIECASPDLYGNREQRDWEKGYIWWRKNCVKKIGKYSKYNNVKIAVATQRGRNEADDFPGGGYLFSENGKIINETENYK